MRKRLPGGAQKSREENFLHKLVTTRVFAALFLQLKSSVCDRD